VRLPAGLDLPSLGLTAPAPQDRWLAAPRLAARRPWSPAASLVLHGLALAFALGLLALPRLTPPGPDQPVEILWEQPPAEESASLPEAEPPAPPPVPPPPQAAPPLPPPPPRAAPPLLMEPPPPALPDSTALLPPPPPPAEQQAETTPEEAEPLPMPPPPAPPPPPRPQQAQPPRPPSPQQTESRQRPVDSAGPVNPTPSAEGSARITGAISPPSPEYRPPQPAFPEGARQRGETGTVRVRLQVDATGQVPQVEVLETSGSRELDRASQEYFRRWRFRPAQRDGQPVASEATSAMTWRLNGLSAGRGW
jgi:protein TonB